MQRKKSIPKQVNLALPLVLTWQWQCTPTNFNWQLQGASARLLLARESHAARTSLSLAGIPRLTASDSCSGFRLHNTVRCSTQTVSPSPEPKQASSWRLRRYITAEYHTYQLDVVPGGESENVGAGDDAGALALHGGLGQLHRVERLLRQVLVLLHVALHRGRRRRTPDRRRRRRRDQDGRVAALHEFTSSESICRQ